VDKKETLPVPVELTSTTDKGSITGSLVRWFAGFAGSLVRWFAKSKAYWIFS